MKKDNHTFGKIEQEIKDNFLTTEDILNIAKKSKDLKRDIPNRYISNLRECLLLLAQKIDELNEKIDTLLSK